MVKPPIQRNATINSKPKEPKVAESSKLLEPPKLTDKPLISTPNPKASEKAPLTSAAKPVPPPTVPSAATTVTTSQSTTQPPPSQPIPQNAQSAKTIPKPVQIQHVPSQFFKIAKWVLLFAGIGYGIASLTEMGEINKLQETSNKAKKGKSKKDASIDDAEQDAIYSLFGSETND